MEKIELFINNEQVIENDMDYPTGTYKPCAVDNIPIIYKERVIAVATVHFLSDEETKLYIQSPHHDLTFFERKKYSFAYQILTPKECAERTGNTENIVWGNEPLEQVYYPTEIHIIGD